jgi:hypothetical protein
VGHLPAPRTDVSLRSGAVRHALTRRALTIHANTCSNSVTRLVDPMEGLSHDIAVLDTCIRAVMDVWRAVPTPDVDS